MKGVPQSPRTNYDTKSDMVNEQAAPEPIAEVKQAEEEEQEAPEELANAGPALKK